MLANFSDKDNIIINTKLFVPKNPEKVIIRHHLLKMLDYGLNTRLTFVSSPAGFGKTTLLSNWIKERDLKVSWYSIDENDNTVTAFFLYLLESLNFEEKLKEQLKQKLKVIYQTDLNSIMAVIINELLKREEPAIIVLDDYHLITKEEIHQAINFFLINLPDNVHIYISSRHSPDVLSVSKLYLKKQLNLIDIYKMRFNGEEVSDFFKNYDISLNDKQLKVMEEKTEGWALSLQLALLSLQEMGNKDLFIENICFDHKYLVGFLLEDVLEKQDEKTKVFLYKTAILDKFNADVCNHLTGIDNSQEIIEYLEKRNMFLVPLDNVKSWYRYHHLFQDLLYKNLVSLNSEEIFELEKKACYWFKTNNYDLQAIYHALKTSV